MKRSMDMEKPFREEKRMRLESIVVRNRFDALSDYLIISILIKTAASANSPSDLLGIISSCKRMRKLVMDPIVLRNVSCKAISVSAKSWCNGARQYLSNCSDAGNADASFMLGMIEFYCLGHYASGADLLLQAAQASHFMARAILRVIEYAVSKGALMKHISYDIEHPVARWAKSVTQGKKDDTASFGYSLWNLTAWVSYSVSINSRFKTKQKRQAHPVNDILTEWWHLPDVKSRIELNGQEFCTGLCDIREMTNDSVEVLVQKCLTALKHVLTCIQKLKTNM